MRSSLIGTLVFIALYMAVSSALLGWTPAANWKLFAFTALLHFVVSEGVRRTKNRGDSPGL